VKSRDEHRLPEGLLTGCERQFADRKVTGFKKSFALESFPGLVILELEIFLVTLINYFLIIQYPWFGK
jgi:hypothetical protein